MKTEGLPETGRAQTNPDIGQQQQSPGDYKHRKVRNVSGQAVLGQQSAPVGQTRSLLSRVNRSILRPLSYLVTHGERLSTRKQNIEQSKSEPQRRLPFLVNNLMSLSARFDGEDKARLYDFSEGCCFGLASCYALYERMGCPEEFDALLGTISQDPTLGWVFWDQHYDNLAEAIIQAQDEFKANPATQEPDTLFLLKLRPFCESLLAFQEPNSTILSKEVPCQNTGQIAQILASAEDSGSSVLNSTPSYPVGLTESGLCSLLNKISETVSESQVSRLFHIGTGKHIISLKVTPEGFETRDQNIRNYKQFVKKELGFVAAQNLAHYLNTSQSLLSGLANPDESTDTVFAIKEFTNDLSAKSNSGRTNLETLLAEIPESELLSIDHRNPHNHNQLLLAVKFQSREVAETVLVKALEATDRNPDFFNQQDQFGQTALTLAIANNYAKVVDKLLDQPGILINQPRQDGAIPLHTACYYGRTETVEKLLGMADDQINHKTKDGSTPIQMAIKNGHTNVVKRLIEHGADIEPSSVEIARTEGHGEITRLIEAELEKRG